MNYDILVNKSNKLDKNYIPNDLVVAERRFSKKKHLDQSLPTMLSKKAFNNFKRMKHDAKKDGFNIIVNSGYRSYEYQEQLLNYYKKKDGDKAYTYCAVPGTSEHQTGLAFDVGIIRNKVYDPNVDETYSEISWMHKNAHKYGFILRYPKGKEDVTKFIYEPWHFRYVGDVATYIYNANLTLEEYNSLKDKQ